MQIEKQKIDLSQYRNNLTRRNQVARLIWSIVWVLFAYPLPRSIGSGWKRFLLRLFGAKIHSTAVVYSSVRIYMPWNLEMEEHSCLAPEVDCYNVAKIRIGSHATVSQKTYLCAASHNISHPHNPLITAPIIIGNQAWIGADVFIGMGVTIGEGAVVGARAAVFKSVEPWTVVGGNPAKFLKTGASMISALVLTYNEENIIGKCLEALSFADEVIVFDSFSSDKTFEIAVKHKAKVLQRKFDNYASQRNAALASVSEDVDWVLMVDADEIVTPELKAEIQKATSMPANPVTMYRVRRKDMFQGKWIKQSSGYPTWFPRLFKNGEVQVEREINEEYVTTGEEGKLQEHLIHYPFNKGLSWWFDKHNRYSQMEAEKLREELKGKVAFRGLLSSDPVIRRKTQKRLIYKLPYRSWIVFFGLYLIRGGFLNGRAGYTFCKLRKTYEWMIELKMKELENSTKAL